jgi:hypothetical protein
MIITRITKQDIKYQPSLKGSCGLYAVVSNGCFYVAGKTQKEAISLRNFLSK